MTKTEAVWTEFHDGLFRFINSRVNDEQTAEDLLQDVFLKIHNKVDSLKENAALGGWVYRIARNTIIDHYRSRKPLEELHELPQMEDEEDDNAARTEIMEDMKGMVLDLPDKYKQALLLTDYEGISQKQLARDLNLSDSGAKSRVQRARMMLRDELMKCCHFTFDRYNQIVGFHPHACCCCPES